MLNQGGYFIPEYLAKRLDQEIMFRQTKEIDLKNAKIKYDKMMLNPNMYMENLIIKRENKNR